MSDIQRAKFKDQAGTFYNDSLKDYRARVKDYTRIADNYQLNPQNIISSREYEMYEPPKPDPYKVFDPTYKYDDPNRPPPGFY